MKLEMVDTPTEEKIEMDQEEIKPTGDGARSERQEPGFTPGPWVVGGTWRNDTDNKSKGETTVIYSECVPLARTIWILNSGEYARSQETAAANARLIAAAPALYEAVKKLLNYGVEFDDTRLSYVSAQIDRQTIADARAALALVDVNQETK